MAVFGQSERQGLRSEVLKLIALVDKSAEESCSDATKFLKHYRTSKPIELEHGDSLQYTYTLNIEYFGDCVEVLTAFVKLMRAGHVTRIDSKELNHTYCLAEDFFGLMKEFKSKQGSS